MKKSIVYFLFIIGIIFSINGCGTNPQPAQVKSININSPKKEIIINLNFPKKDPITNKNLKIDKDNIMEQITNKIYSRYRKYSLVTVKDNSLVNNPLIKIDWGKTAIYKGIQINRNDKEYNISYKNSYNKFTTIVNFKIPYNFSKKEIIIKYPNNYIYTIAYDWKGTKVPPLDSIDNLKQDVFNMLNYLSNIKLYIQKDYYLKGEINVPYNPDSVYANFKRILGTAPVDRIMYESINTSTEKKDYFNLKIKNETYPLEVNIYPYKNGSKVIYKATLSYKIYSDGTTTLTKQDIENAKKEIKRIINN